MAAPILQQHQGAISPGVTASDLSIPITVSEGSAIVAISRVSDDTDVTITSTGLTFTQQVHEENVIGLNLSIHTCFNVSAGSHTVICTNVGSDRTIRMEVLEVSGAATVNGTPDGAAGGPSTSANPGTVTTTIADCLLIAAASTDTDSLGFTAPSNYTLVNNPNGGGEPEQKLPISQRSVTSTGTYGGTTTLASDSWCAGLIALAAPSGGGAINVTTLNATTMTVG
jgi:hypothetical protein